MTHRVNFNVYRYGKTVHWNFSSTVPGGADNQRMHYIMHHWMRRIFNDKQVTVFKTFFSIGGEFPFVKTIGYRRLFYRPFKAVGGSYSTITKTGAKFSSYQNFLPFKRGISFPKDYRMFKRVPNSIKFAKVGFHKKIQQASYEDSTRPALVVKENYAAEQLRRFFLLETSAGASAESSSLSSYIAPVPRRRRRRRRYIEESTCTSDIETDKKKKRPYDGSSSDEKGDDDIIIINEKPSENTENETTDPSSAEYADDEESYSDCIELDPTTEQDETDSENSVSGDGGHTDANGSDVAESDNSSTTGEETFSDTETEASSGEGTYADDKELEQRSVSEEEELSRAAHEEAEADVGSVEIEVPDHFLYYNEDEHNENNGDDDHNEESVSETEGDNIASTNESSEEGGNSSEGSSSLIDSQDDTTDNNSSVAESDNSSTTGEETFSDTETNTGPGDLNKNCVKFGALSGAQKLPSPALVLTPTFEWQVDLDFFINVFSYYCLAGFKFDNLKSNLFFSKPIFLSILSNANTISSLKCISTGVGSRGLYKFMLSYFWTAHFMAVYNYWFRSGDVEKTSYYSSHMKSAVTQFILIKKGLFFVSIFYRRVVVKILADKKKNFLLGPAQLLNYIAVVLELLAGSTGFFASSAKKQVSMKNLYCHVFALKSARGIIYKPTFDELARSDTIRQKFIRSQYFLNFLSKKIWRRASKLFASFFTSYAELQFSKAYWPAERISSAEAKSNYFAALLTTAILIYGGYNEQFQNQIVTFYKMKFSTLDGDRLFPTRFINFKKTFLNPLLKKSFTKILSRCMAACGGPGGIFYFERVLSVNAKLMTRQNFDNVFKEFNAFWANEFSDYRWKRPKKFRRPAYEKTLLFIDDIVKVLQLPSPTASADAAKFSLKKRKSFVENSGASEKVIKAAKLESAFERFKLYKDTIGEDLLFAKKVLDASREHSSDFLTRWTLVFNHVVMPAEAVFKLLESIARNFTLLVKKKGPFKENGAPATRYSLAVMPNKRLEKFLDFLRYMNEMLADYYKGDSIYVKPYDFKTPLRLSHFNCLLGDMFPLTDAIGKAVFARFFNFTHAFYCYWLEHFIFTTFSCKFAFNRSARTITKQFWCYDNFFNTIEKKSYEDLQTLPDHLTLLNYFHNKPMILRQGFAQRFFADASRPALRPGEIYHDSSQIFSSRSSFTDAISYVIFANVIPMGGGDFATRHIMLWKDLRDRIWGFAHSEKGVLGFMSPKNNRWFPRMPLPCAGFYRTAEKRPALPISFIVKEMLSSKFNANSSSVFGKAENLFFHFFNEEPRSLLLNDRLAALFKYFTVNRNYFFERLYFLSGFAQGAQEMISLNNYHIDFLFNQKILSFATNKIRPGTERPDAELISYNPQFLAKTTILDFIDYTQPGVQMGKNRLDPRGFEYRTFLLNLSAAFYKVFGVYYNIFYYPMSRVFSSDSYMMELAANSIDYLKTRITRRNRASIWLNEFITIFYAALYLKTTERLVDFMAERFQLEFKWGQPWYFMLVLMRSLNLKMFGITGIRIGFHGKFGGRERAYRFYTLLGDNNPCLRNGYLTGSYTARQCKSRDGIVHIHVWMTYF